MQPWSILPADPLKSTPGSVMLLPSTAKLTTLPASDGTFITTRAAGDAV